MQNFTMYIGYMMATHLPSVRPTLFKPEFFEHHTSSPFGRIRILKPPLSNGFAVTPMKYRVPPRPIGHDSVSGWEEAEAKVEGRRGKL